MSCKAVVSWFEEVGHPSAGQEFRWAHLTTTLWYVALVILMHLCLNMVLQPLADVSLFWAIAAGIPYMAVSIWMGYVASRCVQDDLQHQALDIFNRHVATPALEILNDG